MAATSISPLRVFVEGAEVLRGKYIHLYKFNLNCCRCGSHDVEVKGLAFKCIDCGNEETATEHEKP